MDKKEAKSDSPDKLKATSADEESKSATAGANPTESTSPVKGKGFHRPIMQTVAQMFRSPKKGWSPKRTSDALEESSLAEQSPKKSPACKHPITETLRDKSPKGPTEHGARPKTSPFKATKKAEGSPRKSEEGSDDESPKRLLDPGAKPKKTSPLKAAAMKVLDFVGIPVKKSPPRRPSTLETDPEVFVPSGRVSYFGIDPETGFNLGGALTCTPLTTPTPSCASPTREISVSEGFSFKSEAQSFEEDTSCGVSDMPRSGSADTAADVLGEVKPDSSGDSESALSCKKDSAPLLLKKE